jgi:hypothetical protein
MPNGVSPDERFEGWVRQIDQITQEIYSIHHHRDLFRRLAEITQQANLPPSVFFDALSSWYAATQSTAVRRQLDTTRGTVSLIRLLQAIERHRGAVSRERHVALWVGDAPEEQAIDLGDGWNWTPFLEEAHANFDRFSGSRERNYLDRALVQADIAKLKEVGQAVKRHVDEAIAHTALRRQPAVVTYDDLNAAIDVVAELVRKYTSLLKAVMIPWFEPAIQQDWTAIFRQPWIR